MVELQNRSTALLRFVAIHNFDGKRALNDFGSRKDDEEVDSRCFGCAVQL